MFTLASGCLRCLVLWRGPRKVVAKACADSRVACLSWRRTLSVVSSSVFFFLFFLFSFPFLFHFASFLFSCLVLSCRTSSHLLSSCLISSPLVLSNGSLAASWQKTLFLRARTQIDVILETTKIGPFYRILMILLRVKNKKFKKHKTPQFWGTAKTRPKTHRTRRNKVFAIFLQTYEKPYFFPPAAKLMSSWRRPKSVLSIEF